MHLGGLDRAPANLQRIRELIEGEGLVLGYTGGGSFVGPLEEAAERMAAGKSDVDATAALGGKQLRVFGRAPWPETKVAQEAMWAPMVASECSIVSLVRSRCSTPRCTSTTRACPEGITRATVLALCARHTIPHAVGDYSLAEAYGADELFCTGTMGEIAAVTELDGRPIGNGGIGPVTARLNELYAAETAANGYPIFDTSSS